MKLKKSERRSGGRTCMIFVGLSEMIIIIIIKKYCVKSKSFLSKNVVEDPGPGENPALLCMCVSFLRVMLCSAGAFPFVNSAQQLIRAHGCFMLRVMYCCVMCACYRLAKLASPKDKQILSAVKELAVFSVGVGASCYSASVC